MIFPLLKKGSIHDVNNYRGISLTNIFGKLFATILNKRLQNWCQVNELIPEEQAGFRSDYSTIDNIFVLQCLVQKYLGKPGGRFYVFFVDFFKAFDWVDRNLLWNVMQTHGCDGSMIKTLKSMYSNVMVCVKLFNQNTFCQQEQCPNAHITEYFQSMSGVKQGCTLSPLLFSIFI